MDITTICNFTCGTCGRDAAEPRIVRATDGTIAEGCVDVKHAGFTAAIAVDHPDYAAFVAAARAAGITGRVYA